MSGIWKIYHDLEESYEAFTNVNEMIKSQAVIILPVSYVPTINNAQCSFQVLPS
jgi:hypothetical protein